MVRTTLPGSDLSLSRVGFGTASLHHLWQSERRQSLLAAALDAGITHFDTAPLYGEGLAETELGRFVRQRRSQLTIASKFGLPARRWQGRSLALLYGAKVAGQLWRRLGGPAAAPRRRELSPAAVERSLEQSLRRLGTDHLDLFLLHEPDANEIPVALQLAELLQRLRTAGKVRAVGLAGQAAACAALAQACPGCFDVLQVEDSLAGHEADAVTAIGRPLQITFGYLRQAAPQAADADAVWRGALARNPHGTVLVSTRSIPRLTRLAELARQAHPPVDDAQSART